MRDTAIVEQDWALSMPVALPCVVERRWSIEWSRRGVAFGYRSVGTGVPSRGRGRTALAAMIGIVGFSALASATLMPPAQPRAPYRVSIAVPEAPAAVRPAATARRAASGRREAVPSINPPVETATAAARTANEDTGFYAAAMATGEMQQWVDAEGGSRYLVAGPLMEQAGERCRDLSLLVRDAVGTDVVSHERRCDKQTRPTHAPVTPANAGGQLLPARM